MVHGTNIGDCEPFVPANLWLHDAIDFQSGPILIVVANVAKVTVILVDVRTTPDGTVFVVDVLNALQDSGG